MFIVKVRDHITADTINAVSEGGLRLMRLTDNKWKATTFKYPTFEAAMQFVRQQLPLANGRNRARTLRDFRIFQEEGRKQTLCFEQLAEREG